MSSNRPSRLRFNFGFLLEATLGTTRQIELDYPTIQVADDVMLSPLQGEFTATRTSEGIYLYGSLQSAIAVECVRCLESFMYPIKIELDELVYYPPSSAPDGELVIKDTGIVDLAPLIRELALLEVPMQPICKPDCLGLCMECGQNLNEGDCGCEEDVIDPRMEVLRSLLES